MAVAYLQNKNAQYYYIADNGKVFLTDVKKHLQFVPEVMESIGELTSIYPAYNGYEQTGFIFRGEALRILSHIFFTKGKDGDCVLTLEADENICGNLDFSTARIYANKEIRICCIHF